MAQTVAPTSSCQEFRHLIDNTHECRCRPPTSTRICSDGPPRRDLGSIERAPLLTPAGAETPTDQCCYERRTGGVFNRYVSCYTWHINCRTTSGEADLPQLPRQRTPLSLNVGMVQRACPGAAYLSTWRSPYTTEGFEPLRPFVLTTIGPGPCRGSRKVQSTAWPGSTS